MGFPEHRLYSVEFISDTGALCRLSLGAIYQTVAKPLLTQTAKDRCAELAVVFRAFLMLRSLNTAPRVVVTPQL